MLGTALAYIPLAFFIARISLAAAIAAGDASLSGGGCCAPAGKPVRANPSARPAADKILKRRFIPILLRLRRYRRSTTRIPLPPASTAMLARPMNKPCSTTPGMADSNPARRGASSIRPRWASTIQWPPSVTKTWPSVPFRSTICPETPVSANAMATARRVAARPNGTTSTGSGKRPSASTHLESSAITIMRSDAAATIFSRSSAPPPPLMRLSAGSISSAPSTVRSSRSISSSVVKGTPQRTASSRVASDVGTPITLSPARTRSPSSSTKCFAVEPVPSPSLMPSRTSSSARAAACRFNSSIVTRKAPEAAADRATGGVRRSLSSVVLRGGTAPCGGLSSNRDVCRDREAVDPVGFLREYDQCRYPTCTMAPGSIAIFDGHHPHDCFRSRRHARGYGARLDQCPQLYSPPRGAAPGPAAFGAQYDRRRRPPVARTRSGVGRPLRRSGRYRPAHQRLHRLLRRPYR